MTTTIKGFYEFLNESDDPHQAFGNSLSQKYGADVRMYSRFDHDIKLDNLQVPKDKRNQGIGTKIMHDITDHADQHQKRLVLNTAVKDPYTGTTSRNRLVRFYKRHGFVENKGRNKDFTLFGGMYRDPKKQQLTEMPLLMTKYGKKTDAHKPVNTRETIGNYGPDYEIQHHQTVSTHTYSLFHKPTNTIHMQVHGSFPGTPEDHPVAHNDLSHKNFYVRNLKGSNQSQVKAHELYHHLITQHGFTVHSGTAQSEGGAKTWERLAKNYPDVKVTHHMFSAEDPITLHHDWMKNYTSPEHYAGAYSFFKAKKI